MYILAYFPSFQGKIIRKSGLLRSSGPVYLITLTSIRPNLAKAAHSPVPRVRPYQGSPVLLCYKSVIDGFQTASTDPIGVLLVYKSVIEGFQTASTDPIGVLLRYKSVIDGFHTPSSIGSNWSTFTLQNCHAWLSSRIINSLAPLAAFGGSLRELEQGGL